jgi:hypothetical protein
MSALVARTAQQVDEQQEDAEDVEEDARGDHDGTVGVVGDDGRNREPEEKAEAEQQAGGELPLPQAGCWPPSTS